MLKDIFVLPLILIFYSREEFDKSEIILETVYDVEQQQYYTVSDVHSDRTPMSAICDHPESESGQTWSEFALSEYVFDMPKIEISGGY